jgi:DNA-3-methyladenine glycosylase
VAKDLLGAVLVRDTAAGRVRGRIVETEGYTGQTDPASHAYRGPTPRAAIMFGPPAHVYVYLSYGSSYCMNVVTEAGGVAGAVLLRALEPLDGIGIMEQNRGGKPLIELCNGPGKLCQAFGITREQNGEDLTDSHMWIEDDGYPHGDVATTSRVGLSQGADLPRRFFIRSSRFVSRGKPSLLLDRERS